MQEQEENIEIIVKPEIDLKRKAQVMYFGGFDILPCLKAGDSY